MTTANVKSTLFNTDNTIELGGLTLEEISNELDWYFPEEDIKGFEDCNLELQMAWKNGTSVPRLQAVTKSNDTVEVLTGWEEFGFEEGLDELINYCFEKGYIK